MIRSTCILVYDTHRLGRSLMKQRISFKSEVGRRFMQVIYQVVFDVICLRRHDVIFLVSTRIIIY